MIKLRYIAIAGVVVIGLITTAMTAYTVDSGNVKIVKRMGRVIAEKAPGGPYFKIPMVDTATAMSVLTLDNGVVVAGVTSDQQTLDVTVAIQWSIAPGSTAGAQNIQAQKKGEVEQYIGDASHILVTYGSREAFDRNILDRRITKVTTDFISKQKLEEIVKERQKFTKNIEQALLTILAEYPIIVDGIQVVSITPSEKYMTAIEAKQIAEVNAQKAVEEAKGINTLAGANNFKRKQEADAEAYAVLQDATSKAAGKSLQFQAEADGILAKANALKAAGANYLQLEYLNKWDGKRSLVVSGSESSGIDFGVGSSIGQQALGNKIR